VAALELHRTYDVLTQLRDEFEPLRAQLLARRPYVSLMDALAEVCNEEIRLRDDGLLQYATVLASHSSSAHPAAPVPLASPPIVPPAARGESVGLHCDHCGHDGHVEAFCYRKKKARKAQAHHSSQGTGATDSGGSERSSIGLETQKILMLLHRLVASTSSGVVGSVTQSSAPTGSAIASQSFTLGPPSAPSPDTDPWYLDSGASFHMTPHSAHLSALRPSYRHCTIHTANGSPLSIDRHGTLCSNSFYVPDVSLVPDLTMQLMWAEQITDHECRVILDPDFCYIQDHRIGHLVGTASSIVTHIIFGSLTGFIFLPLRPPVLLVPCRCFIHVIISSVASSSGPPLYLPTVCFASSRPFRVSFGSRVFRSLSRLSIGKVGPASLSL
jgi:hypothetical protein